MHRNVSTSALVVTVSSPREGLRDVVFITPPSSRVEPTAVCGGPRRWTPAIRRFPAYPSAIYRYRPLSPSMANRIQNRHPPSCVASVLELSGGGPPTSPTSSSSGRFPPKSDEVHARYPATMPEKNSSQTRIGHMLPDVARARAPHDTPRALRSASPRRLPGGDCTTGISTSQTGFFDSRSSQAHSLVISVVKVAALTRP